MYSWKGPAPEPLLRSKGELRQATSVEYSYAVCCHFRISSNLGNSITYV